MNYKKYAELLKMISSNYYHLTLKQQTAIYLSVISEHPDSLSLLYNMHLIDKDMINDCIKKGISGYALTQYIIDNIEIKTQNSDELSLSLFGYVRTITPAELSDYIDDAVTAITEQIPYIEYTDKAAVIEQQMTLDEIEEFTK